MHRSSLHVGALGFAISMFCCNTESSNKNNIVWNCHLFFYLESQYQKKEFENLMIRMTCLFCNDIKDITGGIMFDGCDDLRVYGVC